MKREEIKNKLKELFHKYCSGTVDEKGNCYVPSREYENLIEAIIRFFEEATECDECGGTGEVLCWGCGYDDGLSALLGYRCKTCGGKGIILCEKCKGTGRYLEIRDD